MIGTFLICAIGGKRIMNIEMSGGLIYEIIHADKEWVQGEARTLPSGTKVILPPGTEIVNNESIDFKGGKPRVWVEGRQLQPRKILITGSSGYVGQHLLASIALQGIGSETDTDSEGGTYEIYLAYNALPTFEADLDNLLQHNKLHPSIAKVQPISNIDFSSSDYIEKIQSAVGATTLDAIIHLAALSSPGYCENNVGDAWKVNCPVELLSFSAPIIYLSTDQVYEGTKSYYQEDADETVPVNVYGRTKLAFERVLLGSATLLSAKELGGNSCEYIPDTTSPPPPNPNSTILRSSLILGGPTPLKNGCRKGFPSFLQFIESRLISSTPTDYFINEFRSVVHITDVLRAIKHFLNKALASEDDSRGKVGTYNLGGSTRVSRYDIALKLASHLKLDYSSANGVDRPAVGGVPSPPDISMNVSKIANEMRMSNMDGLNEMIEQTFSA
eukprot:CAMPEP_0201703474 /NCGR_PEP_ID=MMETSP0578-20130828/39858_1 /ASSEMBLY_ACC=CAM_ASM_000663 /TAXON_ID=267565 /ORGANISM="Skeletonema grethea, Strain CCMP 1804" /LENGTH=443 /DNA_ID=CAMNT_0048191265 /DNA_START=38 /DNA_END=1369 /DNA_ORIENTATION=-